MLDHTLLHSAHKLMEAMDKQADANLPKELADIVKFHTKGATASALASAIPGVGGIITFLAGSAFIWTMYTRINSAIGIRLADNIMKTVATGVITNLAAGTVASWVVGSILSFVPGIGNVGAVVVIGGTVYGLTMISGVIYLKVLTNIFGAGEDPSHLTASSMKNIAKEVISQVNVKGLLEEAKQEFKAKKEAGEFDDKQD